MVDQDIQGIEPRHNVTTLDFVTSPYIIQKTLCDDFFELHKSRKRRIPTDVQQHVNIKKIKNKNRMKNRSRRNNRT